MCLYADLNVEMSTRLQEAVAVETTAKKTTSFKRNKNLLLTVRFEGLRVQHVLFLMGSTL